MKLLFRAFAAAATLCLAPPTFGQPSVAIPRTPDGMPDLQGEWVTQFPPFMFQRLEGASGFIVDDAEALRLAIALHAETSEGVQDPGDAIGTTYRMIRVDGQWRTSMLTEPTDGQSPLTDSARQLGRTVGAAINGDPEGPEDRPWADRCLGGIGMAPLGQVPTPNLRKLVQTRDNLVIYSDDSGETRIIGINASSRPAALVSFMGDSLARWEGDVLVIETTHQRGEQPSRKILPGLMVGSGSKVIERISLKSPDELYYQFTVEDPALYLRPWSAEYVMMREHTRIFEHACHEANYSLYNMLVAAREAERKARR